MKNNEVKNVKSSRPEVNTEKQKNILNQDVQNNSRKEIDKMSLFLDKFSESFDTNLKLSKHKPIEKKNEENQYVKPIEEIRKPEKQKSNDSDKFNISYHQQEVFFRTGQTPSNVLINYTSKNTTQNFQVIEEREEDSMSNASFSAVNDSLYKNSNTSFYKNENDLNNSKIIKTNQNKQQILNKNSATNKIKDFLKESKQKIMNEKDNHNNVSSAQREVRTNYQNTTQVQSKRMIRSKTKDKIPVNNEENNNSINTSFSNKVAERKSLSKDEAQKKISSKKTENSHSNDKNQKIMYKTKIHKSPDIANNFNLKTNKKQETSPSPDNTNNRKILNRTPTKKEQITKAKDTNKEKKTSKNSENLSVDKKNTPIHEKHKAVIDKPNNSDKIPDSNRSQQDFNKVENTKYQLESKDMIEFFIFLCESLGEKEQKENNNFTKFLKFYINSNYSDETQNFEEWKFSINQNNELSNNSDKLLSKIVTIQRNWRNYKATNILKIKRKSDKSEVIKLCKSKIHDLIFEDSDFRKVIENFAHSISKFRNLKNSKKTLINTFINLNKEKESGDKSNDFEGVSQFISYMISKNKY